MLGGLRLFDKVNDQVNIGARLWVADDVLDDTSLFTTDHPDQKRKSNR